jgi:hypothetical protein
MTDATTAQRANGGLMPFVRRYTMELILLALIVFLIFTAPGFASLANTLNVLRTVAMLGIIAFGMTAVIIAGEIDLSVGAGAALAGCIVAWFGVNFTESWGGPAALGFGFLCALIVGFFTGFMTGKFRQWFNVPSFITTLALFTALRGAANLITGGFPAVEPALQLRLLRRRLPLRHPLPGLPVRPDLHRHALPDEPHQLRPLRLCRRRQHGGRAAFGHRRLEGEKPDPCPDRCPDGRLGHPHRLTDRVRHRHHRHGDGA